tara:strand:- start:22559 stop:23170 length:612 start_codon:yes stop_codon:yes gene_type:complete
MKKLLVSQRVIFDKKTKTFRDALDHELVKFFYKNKFILIPIPNLSLSNYKIKIYINNLIKSLNIKGIVLSGGNDINEYTSRDKIEKCLLEISQKKHLPVFGICRGMQMMAHYFLIKLKKIKGHVATRHLVINEKNKKKRIVNSFHNWSLIKSPPNFEILYKAKDNTIEAFKNKSLKWEACMWHPEREKIYNKDDCKIIMKLFE